MIEPTLAQQEIRDALQLNLLAIAPAGCGKTEAAAWRVAGLLERRQVTWPQKVLVTTFTNRARDNIKQRLDAHVPRAAVRDRVTVANFHGLAARIFSAHSNVIGLPADLQLPDSDWVADRCRDRGLSYKRSSAVDAILRGEASRPTLVRRPVTAVAAQPHVDPPPPGARRQPVHVARPGILRPSRRHGHDFGCRPRTVSSPPGSP
jgi:DNA helicase II / ATP-dependent DNA helicase PcrA